MIDPRILLIVAAFWGLFYVGEKAVAGVKKVDRAVAHGVKSAGKKIAHIFHHPDEAPE